jgi:ADP-ribose pyrophosphatase YjhB (NUDIX family)
VQQSGTQIRQMLSSLLSHARSLLRRPSRIVTLGAQALVRDGGGQVLLVRHGYHPGWHFPGGGVHQYETLRQALERELAEETGLAVVGEPTLFALYSHFGEFPGDHIALFIVDRWTRSVMPRPNLEIREQRFFRLDDLPPGTNAGTRRRLQEVTDGLAPQSAW